MRRSQYLYFLSKAIDIAPMCLLRPVKVFITVPNKISTGTIPCVGGERIYSSTIFAVSTVLVTDTPDFARDLEPKHRRGITST